MTATTESMGRGKRGVLMYAVDGGSCTGCGLCAEFCPVGAISVEGRVAVINQDVCTSCGACAAECPQDAIYEYEVVPAPRGDGNVPAAVASGMPRLARRSRELILTPGEKAVVAVTLLAAVARSLIQVARRFLPRGEVVPPSPGRGTRMLGSSGHSCAERHRWRGGRG
jgi:ferredoxin